MASLCLRQERIDRHTRLDTDCFDWSTLLLSAIGDVPLSFQRVEESFILFHFLIGRLGTMISTPNQWSTLETSDENDKSIGALFGQEIGEEMDEIQRSRKFRTVNRKVEGKVIEMVG